MTSDGSIAVHWADGEHTLRLAIGQLRELQKRTDAGPAELLDRLHTRRWRVDDLRETLRLGLIGGGMAPMTALERVIVYVDGRPRQESAAPAAAVLLAALVGVLDDPVGNGAGGETEAAGSSSPPSTEPAQLSAGPLARLTP